MIGVVVVGVLRSRNGCRRVVADRRRRAVFVVGQYSAVI
jgi:hypothetical protein